MEQLIYFFSGFRWQDCLDILFISYILFRLYVLFKGTNVFRALLAICGLWAIGQTAVFLGLIITTWAMQGVIAVAALVILIVFRNEIGGVIQTRDLKSFLWSIPRYQKRTPVHIIAESITELASKKIGALIVLPLNQGVDSVVKGGVPVDGLLSKQLLVSLFWPKSPLHDGAVVIQGDRVARAGTILPLSPKHDLPEDFGTRHRAGLGLTEHSDALVIVVSEERGKVSLFHDQTSYYIHSKKELEKRLRTHTGDDAPERGIFRQKLELASAALISLFLITGLWFSFSKGIESLSVQEVPIEFVKPDQHTVILSSSVSSAKLFVSGNRTLINALKPEQIKIQLDLSGAVIGANTLSLAQKDILMPPGIRFKKIEPDQVVLTLDRIVEKTLPVQPHWSGRLPAGLVMETADVSPRMITIRGGELSLKTMATVFTEPIRLDRLSKSGKIRVALALHPESIKALAEKDIQVHYIIKSKVSGKPGSPTGIIGPGS